jgi:DNA-binding NarL/FixJ family response regulator
MRSIFIMDDHDIVRFGLSALLSSNPELTVIGEAANLGDGLKGIAQFRPDLVLSDMSMDDTRGLDTVRSVVAAQGSRHVLIISMHDEVIFAEQVVALGARGYLMKEKAQQHLLAAVQAVLDGQIWVSPVISALLLNRIKPRISPQEDVANVKLSARELEVLQRLSVGRTTKQVAFELGISARTVDIHRASMKKKLGLQSGAELISWAASLR